jgi:hypothetical protein
VVFVTSDVGCCGEREREGRGGREMTCGSKDFFFLFFY